jgi:hypothetical protein
VSTRSQFLSDFSTIDGRVTLGFLIKNYYLLENKIQDRAIDIVFKKFLDAGFTFNSPEYYFAKGQRFLRPVIDARGQLKRDLSIDFADLSGKDLPKEISAELIASYGLIRTISIQSPYEDSKAILGKRVAKDVGLQLQDSYVRLAERFILASQEFTSTTLKGLYLILQRVTEEIPGFDYEKHCWFILFSGNYGYFLLTPEMVIRALEHFKKNQLLEASPIEQLIYLITNPLPFDLTVSNEAFRQSRPWLPGTFETSRYKMAAKRLWLSIARLQDYDDFVVMPISEYRDYHLIFGFKATFKRRLTKAILANKDALVRQFERGLERYSDYVHLVEASRVDEPHSLAERNPEELRREERSTDEMDWLWGSVRPKAEPPQVFISYSRQDMRWREELRKFLSPLVNRHSIRVWDDSHIQPGWDWNSAILRELDRSSLVVILVTQNYLASKFISDSELPAILERQREGKLEVLWIPVSAALIDDTPIQSMQSCMSNLARPLDSLSESEQYAALVEIARSVMIYASKLI